MSENIEKYDPKAAFAFYYSGLILTKRGFGERALKSFKKALVAELHRDDPDGMNLRMFRDKIREMEEGLISPQSPQRSFTPSPR